MSAARKKALTWSLVLVVLLVSIAVIQHVWALSLRSETTDNAQVEGDVVVISSEVSGRFLEVGVLDNQRVSAGQLLARIDSTDYQAHLTQADKALRSAQQREAAARAQLQLTQRQAQASLGEQESGVQLARAGVETASTGVESARQQLLQAQAGTQASRANLARSRTSVDLARAEQKRVDDDVGRGDVQPGSQPGGTGQKPHRLPRRGAAFYATTGSATRARMRKRKPRARIELATFRLQGRRVTPGRSLVGKGPTGGLSCWCRF